MAPNAVVLDFAGVLTNRAQDCYTRFCEREGLAPDALELLFQTDPVVRAQRDRLERGIIGQPEFEDVLARRLRVPSHQLTRRILEDLAPAPAMFDMARRARAAGIRTCCLSNSWGRFPFDPYRAWRLHEEFDAVVLSHETGLRKPDPTLYELTCARLSTDPGECVLVDDTPTHLPAATALGMTTLLCRNPVQAATDLAALLDLHASDQARTRPRPPSS